jgi:hypothetical protein
MLRARIGLILKRERTPLGEPRSPAHPCENLTLAGHGCAINRQIRRAPRDECRAEVHATHPGIYLFPDAARSFSRPVGVPPLWQRPRAQEAHPPDPGRRPYNTKQLGEQVS